MASGLVQVNSIKTLERALKLAGKGETVKLIQTLNMVKDELERTRPKFERLLAMHAQISKYNSDFLRDVSGYGEMSPIDLRGTIEATVRLVKDSLLGQLGKQIRIEFLADQTDSTTKVYCSLLLKQHLYSIFHNAVLAVQERRNEDSGLLGKIDIGITRDLPPTGQEIQLNTSWAVSIRDNGKGVLSLVLALEGTAGWGLD
jgi:signal transduction histidine kinase